MRQMNKDRKRRLLLLSKRLNEIAVVRHFLVVQLEDLERQEKAAQLESNMLHNLDAPISTLPDELLAMIFEAGTLLEEPQRHFGTLVSHAAHQWRHIALATPQLWNKISFTEPGGLGISLSGKSTERAICFLSRCRAFPIDVSVASMHRGNISQGILSLIGDHMGHCRQICIKDINPKSLETAIQYLSPKAAPLLRSIDFTPSEFEDDDLEIDLLAPLFPSGAPHLRIVQLGLIYLPNLHFWVPTLRSVTSLRLTSFFIEDFDQIAYGSFRDALMALDFLIHLELQPYYFGSMQPRLPIVLPTLQFLHLDVDAHPDSLDDITCSFQAAALITLSLDGWGRISEDTLERNFPSLDHLILLNVETNRDLDAFPKRFPGLTRLTYQVATNDCSVLDILDSMCYNGCDQWPKLRVLAVSATCAPLNTVALCDMLSMAWGLQKLMLPKCVFSHVGVDAWEELGKRVEVEDYTLDWPTPFAQYC